MSVSASGSGFRTKHAACSFGDGFVVECGIMRKIYSKAAHVAPYNVSVLITGESGTGKDKLAYFIHNESRMSGSFIHINCSAIPEQLFESKMFGYEQGAFTGALKGGYEGFIEQSAGGTLFLDEIGDMPLELQSKLLTFLEHKQFVKIGGKKTLSADVRIIAATNKAIKTQIENAFFREDLYYRLSTVEIELPPLKDRKEEIPHFINYFCKVYNNKYEKNVFFDRESVELLTAYEWFGNIRELRHVVEKLVLLSPVPCIRPDYIYSECGITALKGEKIRDSLKYRLEQYEKELIKDALQKSRTLLDAAGKLCIDLSTLTRKRRKYGI